MKPKATSKAESPTSSATIRQLCGDIADWKVSAIAALSPTAGEVELAVFWADRQDETREERPLEGKSAQIFDILTADEELEDDR